MEEIGCRVSDQENRHAIGPMCSCMLLVQVSMTAQAVTVDPRLRASAPGYDDI